MPDGTQDRASETSWKRLTLFRELEPRVLEGLEAALSPVDFPPGAVIVRQGEPGREMYLLQSGEVEVRARREGREDFTKRLSAPAVFGEMALVTREPRTATVTARTRARCLRLDRLDFELLVERDARVAAFLTEAVGQRLLEAGTIQWVGKYRILGRIGQGAAATVFEAVHPELEQPVAVKMLSHALVRRPGFAERFQREARLVARLRHPSIVRVLDTEHAYGTHFIIMERLHGELLAERLRHRGPLPVPLLRRLLVQVLRALHYAHEQGLLHRDVKPSNVFLTEDGQARILDFGIAVELDRAREPGHRLGTPYYMSPEQIRGEHLDPRSDLYQVGVMAYELATGRVPYRARTLRELFRQHLKAQPPDPRELRPELPRDLAQFTLRAMAKRPEDRFPSCGEAADFLELARLLELPGRVGVRSLSLIYHPSRAAVVERAIGALRQALEGVEGVRIVLAGAEGEE